MKVRYFVVDVENQLQRVQPKQIEQLWEGKEGIENLRVEVGCDVRILSVLCDSKDYPKVSYFLRLKHKQGQVTPESRLLACHATMQANASKLDDDSVAFQLANWPRDWRHQLAVALDVPAQCINNIGIGGLQPLSETLGISVPRLIKHFREAFSQT